MASKLHTHKILAMKKTRDHCQTNRHKLRLVFCFVLLIIQHLYRNLLQLGRRYTHLTELGRRYTHLTELGRRYTNLTENNQVLY